MKLPLAICQMKVQAEKEVNLRRAEEMITNAATKGARMIVLPEIFNSPYQAALFPDYAEIFPGKTSKFLSRMAKQHSVCLVGGSIVEKDENNKIYNSSYVFDETGELIKRYRKAHLFDIDLPGRISFKESSTLSPGNNLAVFHYDSIPTGLMICYDIRFPELSRALVLEGARLLIIPAAFNLTTGSAHWDLLMRCRAVDNQLFVVAASPARNPDASYQAWGHSMIVDPWGTVIAEADEEEEIILAELDFSLVEKIREELPLLKQRRKDLYQINYKREE